MTKKEVYTKAAQIVIEQETFACCAINRAEESLPKESVNRKEFVKMFEQKDLYNVWWGCNVGETEEVKENQLARSLALLFMAEMESE